MSFETDKYHDDHSGSILISFHPRNCLTLQYIITSNKDTIHYNGHCSQYQRSLHSVPPILPPFLMQERQDTPAGILGKSDREIRRCGSINAIRLSTPDDKYSIMDFISHLPLRYSSIYFTYKSNGQMSRKCDGFSGLNH